MNDANRPEWKTMANLQTAFAGESMAHIKYCYFAKISREGGDEKTALAFEETAHQELKHALSHLDLLYPKSTMTTALALKIAIDGETYEYTKMYPSFSQTAKEERQVASLAELNEPNQSSKILAAQLTATLLKAEKRFAALAKVEERHAKNYQAQLAKVRASA